MKLPIFKNGDINIWWLNFTRAALDQTLVQKIDFTTYINQTLKKYNAVRGYDSSIEFSYEEDMIQFIMEWS